MAYAEHVEGYPLLALGDGLQSGLQLTRLRDLSGEKAARGAGSAPARGGNPPTRL
jgi:hypothetical protein